VTGLRGLCSALWRRRYIPRGDELRREDSGSVGRVTIGVAGPGGGAGRRGGGPTAQSRRAMTGRLVAAVVVRDGLLGGWGGVEGGGGPRGGRGRHKASNSVNDAVRGSGGYGRADDEKRLAGKR